MPREGEAFDIATGLPLSMAGQEPEQAAEKEQAVSWYEFACAYVDMKWQEVSPNSRRSIADALATATPALLTSSKGSPKPAQLRKALYGWAFNTKLREADPTVLGSTQCSDGWSFTCGNVAPRVASQPLNHSSATRRHNSSAATGRHRTDMPGLVAAFGGRQRVAL